MFDVDLPKGKYVVAVSGGVDSMVLLDVVRQKSDVDLVVAHINHGIRPDADQDEALVRANAKKYNIPFTSHHLNLPAHASEERARKDRYAFLQQCRRMYKADAVLTAHHQDDVIETAIVNYMRGTGWRGLAPFVGVKEIVRPLLRVSKDELIGYARKHGIVWREDSTNTNESYLRNYVRHTLIPLLDQKSATWKETFLRLVRKQQVLRQKIDEALEVVMNSQKTSVSRYLLIMLPHSIAIEVLQNILREVTGSSLVRALAESALLFTKTAFPHKIMPINKQWQLRVTTRLLIVEPSRDVIR